MFTAMISFNVSNIKSGKGWINWQRKTCNWENTSSTRPYQIRSCKPFSRCVRRRRLSRYHGYTYERNETTKILKNTRSLKRMIKRNEKTNSVLKSVIAFRSFYKKCFGVLPKTGWQLSLEFVRRNILDLHAIHSVSLTNKVHILFSHVFDTICEGMQNLWKILTWWSIFYIFYLKCSIS